MSAQSPQDGTVVTKVDFLPHLETFHGKPSEVVLVWLLRAKQYFKLTGLKYDHWVYAAGMYLKVGAAIWYYLFALEYEEATSIPWDHFEQAIKSRYRFGLYESSLVPRYGSKPSCKSVREYLERWEKFRMLRPDDDLPQLFVPFTNELPLQTRNHSLSNAPQTFTEMINTTVQREFLHTRGSPELDIFPELPVYVLRGNPKH